MTASLTIGSMACHRNVEKASSTRWATMAPRPRSISASVGPTNLSQNRSAGSVTTYRLRRFPASLEYGVRLVTTRLAIRSSSERSSVLPPTPAGGPEGLDERRLAHLASAPNGDHPACSRATDLLEHLVEHDKLTTASDEGRGLVQYGSDFTTTDDCFIPGCFIPDDSQGQKACSLSPPAPDTRAGGRPSPGS